MNDDKFRSMFNSDDEYNDFYAEHANVFGSEKYDVEKLKKAAHRDADEIASKYKNGEGEFLVLATGDCEVKHKQISSEKKKNMKKKVAAFVVAGVIAILGVVQAGDFINHPENYLTTHPEYKGKVTFSQMIERTPSNFGIGGK